MLYRTLFVVPLGLIATRQGIGQITNDQYLSFPQWFDDAHAHIERARSHTVNSARNLGYAIELQAWVKYRQHKLEEAKSEIRCASDVYEKLGATKDVEDCRNLLWRIQEELDTAVTSGQSDSNCELLY